MPGYTCKIVIEEFHIPSDDIVIDDEEVSSFDRELLENLSEDQFSDHCKYLRIPKKQIKIYIKN